MKQFELATLAYGSKYAPQCPNDGRGRGGTSLEDLQAAKLGPDLQDLQARPKMTRLLPPHSSLLRKLRKAVSCPSTLPSDTAGTRLESCANHGHFAAGLLFSTGVHPAAFVPCATRLATLRCRVVRVQCATRHDVDPDLQVLTD